MRGAFRTVSNTVALRGATVAQTVVGVQMQSAVVQTTVAAGQRASSQADSLMRMPVLLR